MGCVAGVSVGHPVSKAEIKALVRQLKDIVAVLANADFEDRRAIYAELGVNLTHHPDGRIRVGTGSRVLPVGVEGTRGPDFRRVVLAVVLDLIAA